MAHGVNGLRQVTLDFVKGVLRGRNIVRWGLFILWLAVFLIAQSRWSAVSSR